MKLQLLTDVSQRFQDEESQTSVTPQCIVGTLPGDINGTFPPFRLRRGVTGLVKAKP